LFKQILDLGLANEKPIQFGENKIVLRNLLNKLLLEILPMNEKDVVLLKVIGKGLKDNKEINLEYTMIDYYDQKHDITSMMRTTGYPVSIIAQMIEAGLIQKTGVFCSEEIVPCKQFFNELQKRDIKIERVVK
jgi:lysine 6-dehydrogenase